MRVTIKDIAREAGVDIGAVSRTLRATPEAQRLRPETRDRILRIAKELGYQRNLVAASIRTGKVSTIAVIGNFSESRASFSSATMLNGLISECAEHGYSVKFYLDSDLGKAFEEIRGSMITQLVCISADYGEREAVAGFCRENSLDLVFIYEHSHLGFPAVNTDNFAAAKLAVEKLASLGHSRIGLLCVPHHRYFYVEERHDGYLAGMKASGLEIRPELIACTHETEEAVERMLRLPSERRPTALLGITDNLAFTAQRCAVRMGLKLPEELSTFGIGDSEYCLRSVATLSSVNPGLSEYGNIAVKLLLKIAGEAVESRNGCCLVTPRLVMRESAVLVSGTNR